MQEKKENLSEYQLYLFNEGTNYYAYKMLGAHNITVDNEEGYRFAVWAPNAKSVSVVGEFNEWDEKSHVMKKHEKFGVWEIFVPHVKKNMLYKFYIVSSNGTELYKADPYAFAAQLRPETASVTADINNYVWNDKNYRRKQKTIYDKPAMIYEVHAGSWKRHEDGSFLTYTELAHELIPYVKKMGFTHIELMPICEFPYDGSWGYQVTGFYAATSRYGSLEEFKYFVDQCHQNDIAVILDWVPAHFPKDMHGLALFDGSSLYEYEDPRIGEHLEWGTKVFNYKRNEVIAFLISNAVFWFDVFHIDGLRVDAVSSMLYLNYNREDGNWIPNKFGGRENLEAVQFLQKLNKTIFSMYPNALMIAEESTAWPCVTKPVHEGGLGFNYKWNMGWMNDMLRYFSLDPLFRKGSHHMLTFTMFYAFSENYILPLSHDEVVHGKCSLIGKMSGNYEQKFSNLRSFYGLMMAHPGKKLIFMGGEFAQFIEWRYDEELDWKILDFEMHEKYHNFVKEFNEFYKNEKALWQNEADWDGFRWINTGDWERSIISFARISKSKREKVIVICNLTPEIRKNYVIGVPQRGTYTEIFNTDEARFGGNGIINKGQLKTQRLEADGFENRLTLTLPPLSVIFIKRTVNNKKTDKIEKKQQS